MPQRVQHQVTQTLGTLTWCCLVCGDYWPLSARGATRTHSLFLCWSWYSSPLSRAHKASGCTWLRVNICFAKGELKIAVCLRVCWKGLLLCPKHTQGFLFFHPALPSCPQPYSPSSHFSQGFSNLKPSSYSILTASPQSTHTISKQPSVVAASPQTVGCYGLPFAPKKAKGATIGPLQKCPLWHWVQMDQYRNMSLLVVGRLICCALHDLLHFPSLPSGCPCHLGKQTSWRCVCKTLFGPCSKDNFSRFGKANPSITGTSIEGNSVTALISCLF